jgi:hypothetical protein
MKITSIQFLLAALLVSFSFLSCKKKDNDYFSVEYQNMMRENALQEAAFDDVLKVSENILMKNNNAKIDATGAPLGCITDIDTVVTGPSSKTYTINFASSCTSYDGKVRAGTLIVELSGTNYNTTGASLTIHLNNYYINSIKYEGKLISTNLGSGAFKVVVSDEAGTDYAKATLTDGRETRWRSSHIRTVFEGNADAIIINNKYKITAVDTETIPFEGVGSDNYYYKGIIEEELLLDYSCTASGNLRYPIDGKIEFTMKNSIRDVNYGDGLCDYTVVLSNVVNDSKEFSLY